MGKGEEKTKETKRQQDVSLLLVLGGFGYDDKLNLAFSLDLMSATDYKVILETHLLTFAEGICDLSCIFKPDNAPITFNGF